MHRDSFAPIQVHIDGRLFFLTWNMFPRLRYSHNIPDFLRPILVSRHHLKCKITCNRIRMRIIQEHRRLFRLGFWLARQQCHYALHLQIGHNGQTMVQCADRIRLAFFNCRARQDIMKFRKSRSRSASCNCMDGYAINPCADAAVSSFSAANKRFSSSRCSCLSRA